MNEVWFDNVKVPVSNRVGEENKGLDLRQIPARPLRTGIAGVGRCKRIVKRFAEC